MKNILVGYTGFIGETLLKQTNIFNILVNSRNIEKLEAGFYDTVICAGASSKKWLANQSPVNDLSNINILVDNLKNIKCRQFILISTIDVFSTPMNVNEDSPASIKNHPYGSNRFYLENFVKNNFVNHLIIRLPGLVGPGLRKNVIFDLLNQNNLNLIDSRSVYQFYPTVNLWFDIQKALNNNIKLLHLAAQPLSVAQLAEEGFSMTFTNHINDNFPHYNFLSKYSHLWSNFTPGYQYSQQQSLQAIRSYVQSESRSFRGCLETQEGEQGYKKALEDLG